MVNPLQTLDILKRLLAASCVVVAVVLQGSLLVHWRVAGVAPDLVIVVAIAGGLAFGPEWGITAGAVGGILQGVIQGEGAGSFLISRALCGLVAGLLETRLFKGNVLVAMLVVFLGTGLAEVVFLIMTPIFSTPFWLSVLWREAVYNAAVSPVVYVTFLHLVPRASAPSSAQPRALLD